MKNNKKITERLTDYSNSDSFDIEFWRKAGVQARFAAAWKMVEELYRIRGMHGYKLRLQRSIQSIEQI